MPDFTINTSRFQPARSEADRALAWRMLTTIRRQMDEARRPLIDGGPLMPDRQRLLARCIRASRVDAKTALAVALDRLLDELDREAAQAMPFDTAASRVDEAAERYFDDR